MIDVTQNAQNTSSSFLFSADPTPINLDKNVKEDYVLIDNGLTLNVDLDMEKKTHRICAIEPGEISVSCVVPPVPLIEEEVRKVGRVQASVLRWVATVCLWKGLILCFCIST